ncbi:kinase-like protein, partial [Trametes punicea]
MDDPEFIESFNVCGIYQVTHVLGHGSSATVVRAFNTLTGSEVAIKLVPRTTIEDRAANAGRYEAAIYKLIPEGSPGFPFIHYAGDEPSHSVIVMDKLGPSLQALRRVCRGSFTMRTICMLADQLLQRLEFIHSRGIVYCDIKPSNFAMGPANKDPNTVYLFDFGLAKMYVRWDTGEHVPFSQKRHARGNIRYASVAAHERHEVSRRDDVESLLYVLLEFYHGRLPWDILPDAHWALQVRLTGEMKADVSPSSPFGIFLAQSPPELVQYHAHCVSLAYGQKPDYAFLRGLFRKRMCEEGWGSDSKFDWADPSLLTKGTLLPEEYVADVAFVEDREWNPYLL